MSSWSLISNSQCPVTRCPKCREEICRSVRLQEEDEEGIILACTACDKIYEVKNSEEQRKVMTKGDKHWFREEELKEFNKLGVCDVIGFQSSFFGAKYHHSATCYQINRTKKILRLIELMNYGKVARILKRELTFDEMLSEGLKGLVVFRCMPLDCLPLEKTRARALKYANAEIQREEAKETDDKKALEEAEKIAWPSRYDAYNNNCQHFTSFCKTGEKRSTDAEYYRARDAGEFVKGSLQVSSEISGWSSDSSKWSSSFLKKSSSEGNSNNREDADDGDRDGAGWSSSSISKVVWSKRFIKGLVKEWSNCDSSWKQGAVSLTVL